MAGSGPGNAASSCASFRLVVPIAGDAIDSRDRERDQPCDSRGHIGRMEPIGDVGEEGRGLGAVSGARVRGVDDRLDSIQRGGQSRIAAQIDTRGPAEGDRFVAGGIGCFDDIPPDDSAPASYGDRMATSSKLGYLLLAIRSSRRAGLLLLHEALRG